MKSAIVFLLACEACGRIFFDPRADAKVYAIDAGECPPGYMFMNPGCYRVVLADPEATWFVAEAKCEADVFGAHLVVLDTAFEAQQVDSIVPGTILDHWIGANDIVNEGVFLTVTNVPMAYATWAMTQPDGATASNCVVFNDDTTLYDYDCSRIDDYVCEYDGIAAVPAAWGQ